MQDLPSSLQFLILFDSLGEQAKALGETHHTVPLNMNTQFNVLASAANKEAELQIPEIPSADELTVAAFLAQIAFAKSLISQNPEPSEAAGDGSIERLQSQPVRANSPSAKSRAQKPRVFIGCSVEGLRYAKIIQWQLSPAAYTTIWNQGVFGLSRGTLETLVAERNHYDYAILVLTPDDTRVKREQNGLIPRDNVVFELGLFMGALGREHVFMVVQAGTELPTDLAGITPAYFDIQEEINLVSALGPTTTMLEIAMDLI